VDDLISANDIEDRSLIRTGQVLVVPGEGTGESADATPTPTSSSLPAATATPLPAITPTVIAGATTHTVESGETLYGIALLYGVSYTDLAVLNEIEDPSHIWVGQVLKIPQEGQIIATPTPQSTLPTATPTSSPAPAEPTATPTPTGPVYQFDYEGQTTYANCGLTAVNGYVRDANGNGLSGYRVLVGSNTGDWVIDPPAVTDAKGEFEVPLRSYAFANTWWVYVIDGAGTQISPRVIVTTTDTNCEPLAGGVQVVFVNFKRSS
jgi:LysM repeat protein